MSQLLPPVNTIDLFPVLDKKLVELLHSLTPEEWYKPTVAKLWNVKDVAAHILDVNIRALSRTRDKYTGEAPPAIRSNDDLINYLNELNNDWVKAMKRVSPAILTRWLEETGPSYHERFITLDPFAKAEFSVSWAGEETSVNWFHIAREYTEKWHHQQQIRDAVNKPGIMTRELYYPVLDTFMRALPFTYSRINAPEGTAIQISITGEGGGDWFLIMNKKWELSKATNTSPSARTIIDGSVAWKLFSKSWRRKDVEDFVQIKGDQKLGGIVLDMISVVA
jgi:uncharacterized protein (TIGR03083 family)